MLNQMYQQLFQTQPGRTQMPSWTGRGGTKYPGGVATPGWTPGAPQGSEYGMFSTPPGQNGASDLARMFAKQMLFQSSTGTPGASVQGAARGPSSQTYNPRGVTRNTQQGTQTAALPQWILDFQAQYPELVR